MDTLVAQLSPPKRVPEDAIEEGYGNLDRFGAIDSMVVPGVPDVS